MMVDEETRASRLNVVFAAVQFCLAFAALASAILHCGACELNSPASTAIAAAGTIMYAALLVCAWVHKTTVLRAGICLSGVTHSALLAHMLATSHLCPICAAAAAGAILWCCVTFKGRSRLAMTGASAIAALTTALMFPGYRPVIQPRFETPKVLSRADEPKSVRVVVYENPGCPHCDAFREQTAPRLTKEFGESIFIEYRRADKAQWVQRTPTIVVDDRVVIEGERLEPVAQAVRNARQLSAATSQEQRSNFKKAAKQNQSDVTSRDELADNSATSASKIAARDIANAPVPLPANTWTMVPTNGFPINVVGYDNMVYALNIKKMLMWNNYHNITSETNQAMLAYDFTSNRWDIWGLNGNFHSEQLPESGHQVGMMQYDPNHNLIISYCCHSGSQGYERPEFTWVYDAVGMAGRSLQTPTRPGLAPTSSAVFDSSRNLFVLFNMSGGTWTYDLSANAWTKLTTTGTPPSTAGFYSMAYSSTDHKTYVFGGQTASGYTNELYTLDLATNVWTKLNPAGPVPAGRLHAGFAYDSTNHVFLMFSGVNASGVLTDTWVFDPAANAWTELHPAASPPVSPMPAYQRLAYDSDNNAFVMVWAGTGGYANGPSLGYAAQTWFFRYKGAGPSVGTSTANYSPTPGSLNRSTDAWANEPVLASDGMNVVAAWIETGRPFDSSSGYYPHVYASKLTGTTWSQLGASFSALDSEFNSYNEAHEPSIALVNGAPWVSWYKTNNSGTLLPNSLYAKYWNGSAWIGGVVGAVNTAAAVVQSRSEIVAVGSTPHIAFLENDRSKYPWCQNLYVKTFNGSNWVLKGNALNRNPNTTTSISIADSVGMTSDGTNPIIAWTEYKAASSFQADSPPQVYVSAWTGSSWLPLGDSLNVNASNWAYDATIAYANGKAYVAWTERSQNGTPQIYVKAWNGTNWALVGSGALNRTPAGWAFRPRLVSDATTGALYLAWVEQPALGQTPRTYVAKYAAGTWTTVGGALNADATNGSAERAALAVVSGQPVVAWGEVKHGSLRQIYARQWNGSNWASPNTTGGGDTQAPSAPTALSATALGTSQINLSWNASTDNVGVTGYNVYRDGNYVATSQTTGYSDIQLSAKTTYSYTVRALDAAGNVSAPSNVASATTAGAGFTVPSTYNTGHPRLPHPDNAYLLALAANATEFAKYNSAANNWNSKSPSANLGQFRRMLIAYMANKAAGNSNAATAILTKIKQLADFGGTWGPLLYSVNDGVGTGTYTLKSASADFLTGCGGGSCINKVLSVDGRRYIINQVVDAKTVVVSANNPVLSGTNLRIRIFSDYQAYIGLRIAMIYDWLYNDLDAATRTEFMNQLEVQVKLWEEDYLGIGACPYNDVFYVRDGPDGFIAALAIYPDFDLANPAGGTCPSKPCGTYHINWTMDKLFNVFVPVWRQVFGPDGGGWHEDWSGYVNSGPGVGLTRWLVPTLLSWQSASGEPYFASNPWLRNFPYWTMYSTRPDFTMEHIGEVSAGTLTAEYVLQYDLGAGLGSLNGLAEIYDDPVLRGWARLVNQELAAGPSGLEPSAWPFYTPDAKSKAVSARSTLPISRNFTGWGTIFARSGWGESDTSVTLRYGDNFWSHTRADAGAFTISHRGNLAISSSTYRAGSNSPHEIQYGKQAISQNTLLVIDPNDVYPAEKFGSIYDEKGNIVSMSLVNDGGQRRAGTFYNQLFPQFASPDSMADWQKQYEYYHMGTLLCYDATQNYTYAVIDITPAYNNKFSSQTPNSTNRSNRATSVVRTMLFIPPGYVIVYDSISATNPNFKKVWLLHSVNQPMVAGNRYEIRRTENVTQSLNWTTPYASQLKFANGSGASAKYQYNGKLIGWMVQPSGNISVVGGPGKEFWIEDPRSPGTGTNWNQCMQGQASGPFWGFLSGSTPDLLAPNTNSGPIEPGSWRIEQRPATPSNQDYFLNVMLATDADDTNIPATVNQLSDATSLGATWSDQTNTFTVKFLKGGVGGHLTITGAKNVDTDLSKPSGPPTIITHPVNVSAVAGQKATFSVVATGASPLTYQWQKNGTSIAGASGATYTTPALVLTDSGATYRVIVSNTAGSATSNSATLNVSTAPIPPNITTQPSNVTVAAGRPATFSVVATGTPPLTYQWQKNGVNTASATSATYTISSATLADSGSTFRVLVSNSAATVTSSAATLMVNAQQNKPPVISAQPVASPNPAKPGEEVTFVLQANDPDGATLTYEWSYGDNTFGTDPSHTYASPGRYSAVVTIMDALGSSMVSAPVIIDVLGGGSANPASMPLTVSQLQGTVSFASMGRDAISITGFIPNVPANTALKSTIVTMNAGGAAIVFGLNKMGTGKERSASLRLKPGAKKRKPLSFLGDDASFKFRATKGTWSSTWGLDPNFSGTLSDTMIVELVLEGTTYEATVGITGVSTAGKKAVFRKVSR